MKNVRIGFPIARAMKIAVAAAFLVTGCKPDQPESDIKVLNENLGVASIDELMRLGDNQCLVELTSNFSDRSGEQVQRVDLRADTPRNEKGCLPVGSPTVAWRGRIDVEHTNGPTPLSLAVLIDTSGSLAVTDPSSKRRDGVKRLLELMEKKYQGFSHLIRVSLISFKYCAVNVEEFNGGSDREFSKWIEMVVNKREVFAQSRETNYFDAMEKAKGFFDSAPSQFIDGKDGGRKHLVLFSDGMPWMETNEIPQGSCDALVGETISQSKADPKVGIREFFGKAECLKSFKTGKSSCVDVKDPGPGRSVNPLAKNASLDPTNFRMAMLQHLEYVRENFSSVTRHTIFLHRKNTCWELENSTVAEYREQFRNLCLNVAPKDFFLEIVGDKNGNSHDVNSSADLVLAFERVAQRIQDQLEFQTITAQVLAVNTPIKASKICNQVGGKINCPLFDTDQYQLPRPGADNEEKTVNFNVSPVHLPGSGQIQLTTDKTDKDGKAYQFKIKYNFPLDPSRTCGFEEIAPHRIDGDFKQILLQRNFGDKYRITCSKRIGVTQQCELPGGIIVKHQEPIPGTAMTCHNIERCEETTTVDYRCENGKSSPGKLVCPSGYAPKCPEPTVCSPKPPSINETGIPGSIYDVAGYSKGKADNCDEYLGVRRYRCTAEGQWEVIDHLESAKYRYPACYPSLPTRPEPEPEPVPFDPGLIPEPVPVPPPQITPVDIPPGERPGIEPGGGQYEDDINFPGQPYPGPGNDPSPEPRPWEDGVIEPEPNPDHTNPGNGGTIWDTFTPPPIGGGGTYIPPGASTPILVPTEPYSPNSPYGPWLPSEPYYPPSTRPPYDGGPINGGVVTEPFPVPGNRPGGTNNDGIGVPEPFPNNLRPRASSVEGELLQAPSEG